MVCPNCKGYYYVEVIRPYETETCPFKCGYKDKFEEFIDCEVVLNGERGTKE